MTRSRERPTSSEVQQLPFADRRPAGHRHAGARRQSPAEHLGRLVLRRAADARRARRRRARTTTPDPRAVTAMITLPGGETVQGRSCAWTISSSPSDRLTARSGRFRRDRRYAEGRAEGSARRPQGAPRGADRQGHARRDSVPGGTEMTFRTCAFCAAAAGSSGIALGAGQGPRSGRAPQAPRGLLDDVQRRLFREALQLSDSDRPPDREAPHARMAAKLTGGTVTTGAGGEVGGGGLGGGAAVLDCRRRGHRRVPGGHGRHGQGVGAGGGRHALRHAPDNAWAIDARDGRELWHYFWKTRGGTHIATRGFGMWNNYLYMETPDNYLVSLEAKTGKRALAQSHRRLQPAVLLHDGARRHRQSRDRRHRQRSRRPGLPAVVRSGDRRAAVEAVHRADETGRSGSRHVAQPRSGASRRRAAMAAAAPTIRRRSCTSSAPATRRRPTRSAAARATTCSPDRSIAVNVDTGKMAWYYQTAPHDMHDWDSAQTPVLVDALFKGRMRKLVMTAARNGYFFVLDRVTGEHLLTSRYGSATNWVKEHRRARAGRCETRKRMRRSAARSCRRPPAAQSTGSRRLQSRHGPVLRRREQCLFDLLPPRHRSARLDGTGRPRGIARRLRRQLPDRDRLQDRQGAWRHKSKAALAAAAAC